VLLSAWDRVSAAAAAAEPGAKWVPVPIDTPAADMYAQRFHGGDYTPEVRVGRSWTFAQMTAALGWQQGLPPEILRLVWRAQMLLPNLTRADYGIGEGDTLHIVPKPAFHHAPAPPEPSGWNASAVALFRGDVGEFEELARRAWQWRAGWLRRRVVVVAAAVAAALGMGVEWWARL